MYNVMFLKSKGFAMSVENYTKSRGYISENVLCGVGIFIKGLRRSKQKVSIVKAALKSFYDKVPAAALD